ncbi:hypothetical protein [Streptomyces flavofungini]|uniref:Uncharacterized protein n=1 Tax=Streptomyces flavofungini TaxID=68200 RepID=A0ABS0XFV4_9ACTN|nr:hypothetical protein [Streptomyces flavofungini]MBJ3812099.1 hypothetical protein [Streptomyces flavofungini]
MDGGMAAIVAAAIGVAGALGGAAVGGLASVRGARIGGEAGVEAALAQADRQAATGHQQWVKEQRQQACAKLLDAHSAAEDTLKRAAVAIRRGDEFPVAERDAFRGQVSAMQSCTSQLALWGPEAVVVLAQVLRAATADAAQTLKLAEQGAGQGAAESEARWRDWLERSEHVTDVRTQFLDRAGEVLRDPNQPVV